MTGNIITLVLFETDVVKAAWRVYREKKRQGNLQLTLQAPKSLQAPVYPDYLSTFAVKHAEAWPKFALYWTRQTAKLFLSLGWPRLFLFFREHLSLVTDTHMKWYTVVDPGKSSSHPRLRTLVDIRGQVDCRVCMWLYVCLCASWGQTMLVAARSMVTIQR